MSRYTTTRDRAGGDLRAEGEERKRGRRVAGILFGFLGSAFLTGTVAYAVITATATNQIPETVTSGTMSLTMTPINPSVGLSSGINNLMPGDTVNRYVNLINGQADGRALTLSVAATGSTKLSTSSTNGLQITVTSCPVAWNASTGACASPTVLTSSALSGFTTKTLIAGTVPANSTQYLQLGVTLPDQSETTTNGVPDLGTNSIQGLSTNLSWTFTEQQRLATTTNS